jgi:hypothetical protein
MCRAVLAFSALLVIPLGASLEGQTTRPTEAELVNRIDSLDAILRRANNVADAADAARKEERLRVLGTQIDTFQVGPFQVVARVREAGLARRYFEQAWDRYAEALGNEPTALEGHVFIFGKGDELLGLDTDASTRVGTRYMSMDRDREISRIFGIVISKGMPEDLTTWVGNFYIRSDPTRELEWGYRSLVTTPSVVVSNCFEGVLDSCWDAMGLDHQDDWANSWYTASERRLLVSSPNSSRGARVDGIVSSCVDNQRDDACSAVLAERGATAHIPLPQGTRMTLVAQALALGGPEAYRSLATDSDAPIRDRLIQASGVSADSLISSWRSATLQARPDVHGDTQRGLWSTLFWMLILAGVSTRSTRWRLS